MKNNLARWVLALAATLTLTLAPLQARAAAARSSTQPLTQVCHTPKFKLTPQTTITCVDVHDGTLYWAITLNPNNTSQLVIFNPPDQALAYLPIKGATQGWAFVDRSKQEVVLELGKRGNLGLQDAWVMVSVSGYQQE